jgi:hypothetical protein
MPPPAQVPAPHKQTPSSPAPCRAVWRRPLGDRRIATSHHVCRLAGFPPSFTLHRSFPHRGRPITQSVPLRGWITQGLPFPPPARRTMCVRAPHRHQGSRPTGLNGSMRSWRRPSIDLRGLGESSREDTPVLGLWFSDAALRVTSGLLSGAPRGGQRFRCVWTREAVAARPYGPATPWRCVLRRTSGRRIVPHRFKGNPRLDVPALSSATGACGYGRRAPPSRPRARTPPPRATAAAYAWTLEALSAASCGTPSRPGRAGRAGAAPGRARGRGPGPGPAPRAGGPGDPPRGTSGDGTR